MEVNMKDPREPLDISEVKLKQVLGPDPID